MRDGTSTVANVNSDGLVSEVGGLEEADTFKHEARRHNRFASHKLGLAVLTTAIDGGVGGHGTHQRIGLAHARVTSHLTEALVGTQVLHERRIGDTTVVTVSKHRGIPLAEFLNNFQQVGLNVKLVTLGSVFSSGVRSQSGRTSLDFAVGVVVTALGIGSRAASFRFRELVKEDAIAPTTVVIKQGQRTDGLVEHVEVPGVQQQTLSGHQSLTSNFEGAREVGVVRVSRAGVLTQRHKHLVLNDGAAVGRTDRLVLGALTLSLGSRVAPETITVKLNGLTGLFGKVVDNDRLGCHFHNVSWMGTVQLRTQQLREIVIDKHVGYSA